MSIYFICSSSFYDIAAWKSPAVELTGMTGTSQGCERYVPDCPLGHDSLSFTCAQTFELPRGALQAKGLGGSRNDLHNASNQTDSEA